jgi:hypothetical protein
MSPKPFRIHTAQTPKCRVNMNNENPRMLKIGKFCMCTCLCKTEVYILQHLVHTPRRLCASATSSIFTRLRLMKSEYQCTNKVAQRWRGLGTYSATGCCNIMLLRFKGVTIDGVWIY